MKIRIKEQNLHLQRKLQNLSQINGCAKFLITVSRLKHDIDANYVGFCSKILDLIVSISHYRAFEADKLFFWENATRPYLYSQPDARWLI